MRTNTGLLELMLKSSEPVKALLEKAAEIIESGNTEDLNDIDVLLVDRFVEYVRRGTKDDMEALLYSVLGFTESEKGDALKDSGEKGKRFFYRWEHFHDLCECVTESHDPDFTARLIKSRKHGEQLLTILAKEVNGVRPAKLAEVLKISQQQLSRLLREFEEEELIERTRDNKTTLVTLGFEGREYIGKAVSNEQEEEQADEVCDPTDTTYAGLTAYGPKELLWVN